MLTNFPILGEAYLDRPDAGEVEANEEALRVRGEAVAGGRVATSGSVGQLVILAPLIPDVYG